MEKKVCEKISNFFLEKTEKKLHARNVAIPRNQEKNHFDFLFFGCGIYGVNFKRINNGTHFTTILTIAA